MDELLKGFAVGEEGVMDTFPFAGKVRLTTRLDSGPRLLTAALEILGWFLGSGQKFLPGFSVQKVHGPRKAQQAVGRAPDLFSIVSHVMPHRIKRIRE